MEQTTPARRRTWKVQSGRDIGLALAEIRRARGDTQEQFASQIGTARSYLAGIESGQRHSVLLDHILRALGRSGATLTISLEERDATP